MTGEEDFEAWVEAGAPLSVRVHHLLRDKEREEVVAAGINPDKPYVVVEQVSRHLWKIDIKDTGVSHNRGPCLTERGALREAARQLRKYNRKYGNLDTTRRYLGDKS